MLSDSSINPTVNLGSGLLNNLLIMLLSAIVPLIIGIGLTILVGKVEKKGLRIPLRIVGTMFYSLAPIALLLFLFFNVFGVARAENAGMISVILTIMISHLGFFMIFYDASGSIKKNIVVNIMGLFSSTFLWSMAGSFVGVHEIISCAKMISGKAFEFGVYGTVLLICFAILAALNIPRMILKEVMK